MCDEYQEQASQYIDGELSDEDSENLFRHLSACADCRWFLRSTLELRSKIQDEMLMETENSLRAQPSGFTTAFATEPTSRRSITTPGPAFFRRKLTVSPALAAGMIVLIIIITALIAGPAKESGTTKSAKEVVYATSLPTVEVQGLPITEKTVKQ